jgi:hypothetical protein
MKIHRDRSSDDARRQRTARRFAVGLRRRLAASNASDGLPARPSPLSYPAAFSGRSRPSPVMGTGPKRLYFIATGRPCPHIQEADVACDGTDRRSRLSFPFKPPGPALNPARGLAAWEGTTA